MWYACHLSFLAEFTWKAAPEVVISKTVSFLLLFMCHVSSASLSSSCVFVNQPIGVYCHLLRRSAQDYPVRMICKKLNVVISVIKCTKVISINLSMSHALFCKSVSNHNPLWRLCQTDISYRPWAKCWH